MTQIVTHDEAAGRAEQLDLPFETDSSKVSELRDQLDLITSDEFAATLGITEQTLAGWRCNKQGPTFTKLGKTVFYLREDLKVWITKCRQEPA